MRSRVRSRAYLRAGRASVVGWREPEPQAVLPRPDRVRDWPEITPRDGPRSQPIGRREITPEITPEITRDYPRSHREMARDHTPRSPPEVAWVQVAVAGRASLAGPHRRLPPPRAAVRAAAAAAPLALLPLAAAGGARDADAAPASTFQSLTAGPCSTGERDVPLLLPPRPRPTSQREWYPLYLATW